MRQGSCHLRSGLQPVPEASLQPCPKPACNPCPKVECPKPACPKVECPKPVCCKVEPECHKPCFKICWEPGYCLHKCKEKLCGLCNVGSGCHGGCGTAATPNACGSTTIPPATAPVTPAPKAMPDVKKVGSAYPMVRPNMNGDGSVPRTIDLTTGSPF